jgi:hypothetical protein
MEWLLIIPIIALMFLWCCLIISSRCDEIDEEQRNKEEKYRSLDPKSLDDDVLLDKFMEENILNYEEENREIEDNDRK